MSENNKNDTMEKEINEKIDKKEYKEYKDYKEYKYGRKTSGSDFEAALEQGRELARKEFLIEKLEKQVASIEAETIKKLNQEYEKKFKSHTTKLSFKEKNVIFWLGFIAGIVFVFILFWLGILTSSQSVN
jgi:hypothetical protein